MDMTLSKESASSPIWQKLSLKKAGLLNVCCYSGFKPVIYEQGQGFEADLLRAIVKLWNIRIKFHPQDDYEGIWNEPSYIGSIFDLAAGGFDPNIHGKNNKNSVFSIPTAFYYQSLLVLKRNFDSGKIINYNSFYNTDFQIGVLGNSTGEKFGHLRAKEHMLPMSIFKRYDSEASLLLALKKGEIEAIARGSIGNDYQSFIDPEFLTIDKKNFDETFAYSIDPANDELLTQLNLAIKTLTDEGKLSFDEWFKDRSLFDDRANHLLKKNRR